MRLQNSKTGNSEALTSPCSRRAFVAGACALIVGSVLPGCDGQGSVGGEAPGASNEFDVVVIGAGAAGMAAAIAAFDAGVQRVLVLEKASFTGGNSCLTTSGMNAAGSFYQQQAGIQDTPELFAQDTMTGGHGRANYELVSYLCSQSGDAITWLAGMGIVLNQIVHAAGAELARCHRPSDGVAIGAPLVLGLEEQLSKRSIEVRTGMRATSLLKDAAGAIVGVMVAEASSTSDEEKSAQDASSSVQSDNEGTLVAARAVVLATGGLASNAEMVRRYRPDVAAYRSTNQSASTGDGYVLAEEAGAVLDDMEYIQVHATVSAERPSSGLPNMAIAEALRTAGAVLLNKAGERFVNETDARETVAAGIAAQEDQVAWLVFDDSVVSLNPAVDTTYRPNGLVVDAPNADNLATQTGMPLEALLSALDDCARINSGESADLLYRSTPTAAMTGALHAICVTPGVHYEMGGVRINTASQVLDVQGMALPGLYAAGEVTGGVHGANRIAGNGVCDAVVFGRNAGLEAAAYVRSTAGSPGAHESSDASAAQEETAQQAASDADQSADASQAQS